MPTCGNCGKSVAASDVTCPHCGVLLAAYTSPIGSGAAETYVAPPPPPPAEIPSVEMDVKPPSEAEIVTDPAGVAAEPISTAPRPLFDTYLTVEEIARAAEGDHDEEVVTISNRKINTRTVEFDTPDWAKPPADADPIPTIDEVDDSIPLITHVPDTTEPNAVEEDSPVDEAPKEPATPAEDWLHAPSPKATQNPKVRAVARPAADSGPRGTTDEYIRRLHQEAGFEVADGPISKPVEQRRISPAERSRNRRPAQQQGQSLAADQSTAMGCSAAYILVLAMLWFTAIGTIVSGNVSPVLLFVTFAATWGFGPVRRFINEMRAQ